MDSAFGTASPLVGSHHCVFGIARHSKLGNVETLLFHLRRHSHALRFVDAPENNVSCTEGPKRIQRCSSELNQELPSVTVDQASYPLAGSSQVRSHAHAIPSRSLDAVGKDAHGNSAQPSARTMHRNRPARVIHLEHPVVDQNSPPH